MKDAIKDLKKLSDTFEIRMKKAQKGLREQGKRVMKVAFAEFFKAYPQVKAVRWNQYTPYFNDGEECTFSVNDVHAQFEDTPYDSNEDEYGEEGFETAFSASWRLSEEKYGGDDFDREKMVKRSDILGVERLERALQSEGMEELLRSVFGDHVQVTITPKKVAIEEYEHE